MMAIAQYLRAGWSEWSSSSYCAEPTYEHATVLDENDRTCRSINILLVTDGVGTNCRDGFDFGGIAKSVPEELYEEGVTIGGKTWTVRTHVIDFSNDPSITEDDDIAAAGGTGQALVALSEERDAEQICVRVPVGTREMKVGLDLRIAPATPQAGVPHTRKEIGR